MDSLSLITTHNVHQAITDPEAASNPLTRYSPSQSDKHLPEPSLPLITTQNMHQAITDPESASFPLIRHSPSQLADKPLPEPLPEREHNSNINPVPDYLYSSFQPAIQESPKDPAGNSITRKSSLDYASHFPVVYATPHTTDRLKGGSFFKLLSRRKKKRDDFPGEKEFSLPPQTPPKDGGNVTVHPMLVTRSDIGPPRMDKILHHQRSRSMLDLSSGTFRAPDFEDVIAAPENRPSHHLQDSAQFHRLPLQGKWARKGTISDPEERARQRRDLQLQKEKEEQALVKEEAERQRRLKMEKEMVLQQEKEEEAQRLAEIEQKISRIRLERRRLEQAEKEEEEQQRRKIEDRKQRDRKRRMEEHQRAEEWRKHKAEIMEAAAREAAEIQQRDEAKRKYKIQLAEAEVKQTKEEKDLTGWITMQSRDEVIWKRRYFKFVATTMLLYRSAEVKLVLTGLLELTLISGSGQDMTAPLEKIDLQGNVGDFKEWYEGCYEDLRAIAFSFVVEFKNGREPISMYADSEEEKVGSALNTLNCWLTCPSTNF